jgi:hypothetical protein
LRDLFAQYYNVWVRANGSAIIEYDFIYYPGGAFYVNHSSTYLTILGSYSDDMGTDRWATQFPNWDGTKANLGKIRINDSWFFAKTFRGINGLSLQKPTNASQNPGSFAIGTASIDTVTVGGLVNVGNNINLLNGTSGDNKISYSRPSLTIFGNGSGGRFTITNGFYGSFFAGGILVEASMGITYNSYFQFRSARASGWIASNYARGIGCTLINNTTGTIRTSLWSTNTATPVKAAETHEDGGMLFYGPLRFNGGYEQTDTDGSAGEVLKTDGAGTVAFDYVDFLELGDVTNTTYTGLAGAVATVNAGETGLELISGSEAGQTVVKGASSTSFGYLLGQVINRQWYRPITPIAGRAIGTTFGMEGNAPLSFKATGTSMTVTGQVYCDVAAGEVLSLALSDSSVTFNDVGFTEMTAFENGGSGTHPIYSTVTFDFQVSGLTAGTPYTWYLALKSSSTSSRYLVGLTAPALVLEAKHAG